MVLLLRASGSLCAGPERRDALTQGRCAGLCRLDRRCLAKRSPPPLRGLSTRPRKALVARYRHRPPPPVEVSALRRIIKPLHQRRAWPVKAIANAEEHRQSLVDRSDLFPCTLPEHSPDPPL